MTGVWFAELVVVLVGDVLLVAAGLRGLMRPGSLRAALRQHQLLPAQFRGVALVRAFEAGLLVVGSIGIVAGLLAVPFARLADAATAFCYATFVVYLAVLWRTRGSVRCGCLNGFERVGAASIGRNAVIAAAASVAVFRPPVLPPGPRWFALAVAAFLVALTITLDLALTASHPAEANAVGRRSGSR
jgi:hypothetical protein